MSIPNQQEVSIIFFDRDGDSFKDPINIEIHKENEDVPWRDTIKNYFTEQKLNRFYSKAKYLLVEFKTDSAESDCLLIGRLAGFQPVGTSFNPIRPKETFIINARLFSDSMEMAMLDAVGEITKITASALIKTKQKKISELKEKLAQTKIKLEYEKEDIKFMKQSAKMDHRIYRKLERASLLIISAISLYALVVSVLLFF